LSGNFSISKAVIGSVVSTTGATTSGVVSSTTEVGCSTGLPSSSAIL
jgi:hypothetical protein